MMIKHPILGVAYVQRSQLKMFHQKYWWQWSHRQLLEGMGGSALTSGSRRWDPLLKFEDNLVNIWVYDIYIYIYDGLWAIAIHIYTYHYTNNGVYRPTNIKFQVWSSPCATPQIHIRVVEVSRRHGRCLRAVSDEEGRATRWASCRKGAESFRRECWHGKTGIEWQKVTRKNGNI